jgi:hypothetical protein
MAANTNNTAVEPPTVRSIFCFIDFIFVYNIQPPKSSASSKHNVLKKSRLPVGATSLHKAATIQQSLAVAADGQGKWSDLSDQTPKKSDQ